MQKSEEFGTGQKFVQLQKFRFNLKKVPQNLF